MISFYCYPVKLCSPYKIRAEILGWNSALFIPFAVTTTLRNNMSKNSKFSGQPIYSQIINLLNRAKIEQISHETPGSEDYVKRLDAYRCT